MSMCDRFKKGAVIGNGENAIGKTNPFFMGDGTLPDGWVSSTNFPINTQPEILHKMEETFNNFMERNKEMVKEDNINHPKHYTDGKIEVIDFIEDKKLGFHLGNVVKYVSRSGKKDESKTVEDLKKARWYLDRKIEKLEKVEEVEEPVILERDLQDLIEKNSELTSFVIPAAKLLDKVPDNLYKMCLGTFYLIDSDGVSHYSGKDHSSRNSPCIILNSRGYNLIMSDETFSDIKSIVEPGYEIRKEYEDKQNKS